MSKVIEATCQAGIVTAEGVPVSATILSEGVGASSGILIIDQDQSFYSANTTPDLKTTLQKVTDSLDKLGEILADIGSGMAGSSTAPPANLATDLVALAAISTELKGLTEALR